MPYFLLRFLIQLMSSMAKKENKPETSITHYGFIKLIVKDAGQHKATGREQDTPSRCNENEIEPQCNLSKQVILESTRKHNMQKETMEGHPKT